MLVFTVNITESSVIPGLDRLIAFGESPQPALLAIGEKMLEFTKERFDLSEDPYGVPWEPNSDATLRSMLHGSGKNFTKKGGLSKKGSALLAGKKPLIGASLSLSTQWYPTVIGDSLVTLSSPIVYAAMQNYGGSKAKFPNLWGDIPARQMIPDQARGLPDVLQQDISAVLRISIRNAVNGT